MLGGHRSCNMLGEATKEILSHVTESVFNITSSRDRRDNIIAKKFSQVHPEKLQHCVSSNFVKGRKQRTVTMDR
ncbi:hypothetical protein V6N11_001441 [Hibiscus sabdariffa]|uniref:Uncharacterized protein n=1 Tax=Hibiscus sabdariffa TaxID=183260 RepID=A0ABR2S009_9ROSI